VFLGKGVRIFGPVALGDDVVIDDGVTLGYPSPQHQALLREAVSANSTLDSALDTASSSPTSIASGAVIRSHTVIYEGVQLGFAVDCAHGVFIREGSVVGAETYITPGTQISQDVLIGHGCRLAGTICNRTRIGHGSIALGYLVHKFVDRVPGKVEMSPSVGVGALLGRGSMVIGPARVNDFACVGGGAIVVSDIEAFATVVGNPAHLIGISNSEILSEVSARVRQLLEHYEPMKGL
jgi:serine acetyltransferase